MMKGISSDDLVTTFTVLRRIQQTADALETLELAEAQP
jgi:hypothetical protein